MPCNISIATYIEEIFQVSDSLILGDKVKADPEVMLFALGLNEHGRLQTLIDILNKYYNEN